MSDVIPLAVIGKGRATDRTAELCEALIDLCYEIGEGMPIASIIGCLELAKAGIIGESVDQQRDA